MSGSRDKADAGRDAGLCPVMTRSGSCVEFQLGRNILIVTGHKLENDNVGCGRWMSLWRDKV